MALTISLLLSLCVGTSANAVNNEPKYYDQASALYELGLFKGTGTNADGTPIYDLLSPANRIQGLVMLIRLLGEEQDALAFTGTCPFTDVPTWAQKYAAYAYAKGYTKGTTASTFGADDALVGKAYLTFVLRALGYSDAHGDFSYNDANTFAVSLGLIAEGQCEGNLLRDDCAMVSHSALRQKMKGTDTKLAEKLVADSVLTTEAVDTANVLDEVVSVPCDLEKNVIYSADVIAAIPEAAFVSSGGHRGNSLAEVQWHTDSVRMSLLMDARPVRWYFSGREKQLKLPQSDTACQLYRGDTTIIKVLDADFRLIAYSVLYPNYAESTVRLTKCSAGGKAEIEKYKKLSQTLPTLDNKAVYQEIVKTVYPDGTEKSESYLRIDAKKLPAKAKSFVFYDITASNMTIQELIIGELTSYTEPSLDVYGETQFGGFSSKKADSFLFLYDADKMLVTCCKLPEKLPVVETVITAETEVQQTETSPAF